jgi:coenzyme F420 hydrogenase subunit beta
MHPLEAIVANRQCIGCGFCRLLEPEGENGSPAVELAYEPRLDHFVPRIRGWRPGEPAGRFVCPAAEMNMPELARTRYGREPADPMLGEAVAIRAAYASNPDQRSVSASGGVIPVLLQRLFHDGAIDAAYVVRSDTPPFESRGRLVTAPEELSGTHGSVYHPVDFGFDLQTLVDGEHRFAFVGLPCQVAALEMLKRGRPDVARRHVISIGLFCGGINTFRGIDYYLRGHGVSLRDAAHIDYRYGKWPGQIRLQKKDGQVSLVARIRGNTRFQILRYVIAFQGYWMLPRCRICPDQIADFADIAVGDPHLARFRHRDGLGFSAVITRTPVGEQLVSRAIAAGDIEEEELSREELVRSQGYTLDNRRHAAVYASVWKKLGQIPPRLSVYRALSASTRARHYVYAWVDLVKLLLPDNRLVGAGRLPWQIFEYTFITFAPSLIINRLGKILRNRGDQA